MKYFKTGTRYWAHQRGHIVDVLPGPGITGDIPGIRDFIGTGGIARIGVRGEVAEIEALTFHDADPEAVLVGYQTGDSCLRICRAGCEEHENACRPE